ncbi:BPSL0067 family protein [Endosaccharibacter trunci]|uniref:BPSL0067 family protein n=1 Tax=Endosaccharibacter trunci TaxID=2812733 RepID=UPI003BF5257E
MYLGQTADGIQVLDQWHGRTPQGTKPVHERTIHFRGYGAKVDDGDAFYVVE